MAKPVAVILALAILLPPSVQVLGAERARQGPLPDFTFKPGSNWTRPASPVLGDDVWVFVKIQNIGEADYVGTYVAGFWLVWTGDPETSTGLTPYENDADLRDLPAGGSVEINLAFRTTALGEGSHTITVVVDDENLIEESDETNNIITFDLDLPPPQPVDVLVPPGGISVDPSVPLSGDNVTVCATVANAGPGMARSADVFFYLGDTDHPLGSVSLAVNLTASSSATVTAVWNTRGLPAGIYEILVFVHPAWSYAWMEPDTDPSNNNASLAFPLGTPGVDLRLDDFSADPPDPRLGDDFNVSIVLTNNATRTVVEVPVVLLLDEAPILVRSLELRNLTSSGLEATFSTSELSEGAHALRLRAANIDEALTLTVHVPRPDLAVIDLSWVPLEPDAGGPVRFSVKVANLGDIPSPGCELALFGPFGDGPLTAAIPTIRPGHYLWQELGWNGSSGILPGPGRFRAWADPGNTFEDANRTNNILEREVAVEALADLSVAAIDVAPATVRRGDVAVYNATVLNLGSGASGAANAWLEIDGRVVDRLPVSALPPGGNAPVSLSWDTAGFAPGDHRWELAVAAAGGPSDPETGNNNLSGSISLLPPAALPNLVTAAIQPPAGPVRAGEALVLGVTVGNTGGLDAGACSLSVTVTPPYGEPFPLPRSPFVVPPVPAGGSARVDIAIDAPGLAAGANSLDILVDSQGAVAESDEGDNGLRWELTVPEPFPAVPELDIAQISFQGRLEDGEAVEISVLVRNIGALAVSGAYLEVTVDGEPVWGSSLESIPGHGNRTVFLRWTASGGLHSVRATVSAGGGRAVSGELTLAVGGPASLNGRQAGDFALGSLLMLLLLAALLFAARIGRPGGKRRGGPEEEE